MRLSLPSSPNGRCKPLPAKSSAASPGTAGDSLLDVGGSFMACYRATGDGAVLPAATPEIVQACPVVVQSEMFPAVAEPMKAEPLMLESCGPDLSDGSRSHLIEALVLEPGRSVPSWIEDEALALAAPAPSSRSDLAAPAPQPAGIAASDLPRILEQIQGIAEMRSRADGAVQFELKLPGPAMGAVQVIISALGDRRIGLRVVGLGSAAVGSLVERLRARGLTVEEAQEVLGAES